MQLSQLFRRGIVRPIDEDAAKQLSSFQITQPVLVEWLLIPSDAHFRSIWESGLLQRINESCGVAISDFEDVELPPSLLERTIQAVRQSHSHDPFVSRFTELTTRLLERARLSDRSVFFVL
jgi:hypothetical protein